MLPPGASVRKRDQAAPKPAGSRREGHARDLGRATSFSPRDAHIEATGQASQRGARGVQVADARSITASSQRPGWPRATRPSAVAWKPIEASAPLRTRDDAPNVDVEGRHRHAVRGRGDCAGRVAADPGSRCRASTVLGTRPPWSATIDRAVSRRLNARLLYPSPAHAASSSCVLATARSSAVGQRSTKRRHAGPTRSTPVCWLMTSATRTSHGVAASRIRRGRRVCACQRKS